jgi:hypothetical protein
MLIMFDVKVLSKLTLLSSLLFSTTFPAFAMDPEDTDEFWTRICAMERAEADKKKAQPKQQPLDLGLSTEELTDEEVWALIQTQQGYTPEAPAGGAFTDEDWRIILKAGVTPDDIWTTNPGPAVPEDHVGYRLRAENMPDSQTTGDGQGQAKGLGDFVRELERSPNRDEIWAESLAKKDKRRETVIQKK